MPRQSHGVARHNFLKRPLVAVAAAALPVTWSTTNKNARVTLSSGNTIATADATGVQQPGRTDTQITGSQLIYLELGISQFDPGTQAVLGFGNASMSFADNATPGFGAATDLGWFHGGTVWSNGAQVATWASYGSGDALGFAFNMAVGKVWGRVNTGNWNNDVIGNQNPVGNVGGLTIPVAGALFPAYSVFGDASFPTIVLGHFTAASFANAAPSGYSAYGG
jgi:hypothetical protein